MEPPAPFLSGMFLGGDTVTEIHLHGVRHYDLTTRITSNLDNLHLMQSLRFINTPNFHSKSRPPPTKYPAKNFPGFKKNHHCPLIIP